MAHYQERTLVHLDHLHETTIMSAHVLVSGTLFRAPEERTGKASGKSFVAATVARRGNVPPPAVQDRVSSIIEAPRGEHSAKP